jgi:long-chain acyl-CoA synthetase
MKTFSSSDALRVCRDLAHAELSELSRTGHVQGRVPARLDGGTMRWHPSDERSLELDSLARMALATAAATWCNAHDSGHSDLFLAKKSVVDWADVLLNARAGGAQDFTFATSGSTGARKFIRHSEELLNIEAQHWAELVARSHNIRRVVALVPTHHIYGLIWAVLLPKHLNVPVRDLAWDEAPDFLPGDLIVGIPDQWLWYAQSRKVWPEHCLAVSSTAPLATAAHLSLQAQGLDVWQIYGSSETAGLGWRRMPQEPFELFGNRKRQGDAIALKLPNGQLSPLQVQDHLSWEDATRFHLNGRRDEVVQVAGHNISPHWVVEQIKSLPGVAHAAVRLDERTTPKRLKAFVVPESAIPLDANALMTRLRETLPAHAMPWHITTGSQLPRNPMGKLSDWAIDKEHAHEFDGNGAMS